MRMVGIVSEAGFISIALLWFYTGWCYNGDTVGQTNNINK